VIQQNLIYYEFSKDLAIESVLLEFELEVLNESILRFCLLLVQVLEVGVLESLLSAESLIGVIAEEFAHQVKRIFFDAREELLEADPLGLLLTLDQEVADASVLDLVNQALRRETQEGDEALNLLRKIFFPEYNLAEVELGENTTC
jgi:hypothetical protein